MSLTRDAFTHPGDARRPLPEPVAGGQVLLRKAGQRRCQAGNKSRPERFPAGNDRVLTQDRGM
eukprot:6435540-Pyramimonas_sp.AAC.1